VRLETEEGFCATGGGLAEVLLFLDPENANEAAATLPATLVTSFSGAACTIEISKANPTCKRIGSEVNQEEVLGL